MSRLRLAARAAGTIGCHRLPILEQNSLLPPVHHMSPSSISHTVANVDIFLFFTWPVGLYNLN
jgi:hypothetical protein